VKAPSWASFALSLVVWTTGLAYLFLRPWQPASPVAWAILAGLGAVVIHWFGGSGSVLGLIQDLNALAQAVSQGAPTQGNPTTAPAAPQPAASPAFSVSSSPPAPSQPPSAPSASGGSTATASAQGVV
jgi:hypothetical protein